MGKLGCSKNIIVGYELKDNTARDCDGPNGNGVEESCLRNCSFASNIEEELAAKIGHVLLKRINYEY